MNQSKHSRQKGAALVMGLILLAVITLLAVVGMNISNSELAGATSEQLRMRAFNAAETGLEVRMQTLRDDGSTSGTPDTRAATAVEASPLGAGGSATDQYATVTTYRGEGSMLSRFSTGTFGGFHFTIESTGTSARNAQAVHTQGAFIVNGVGGGDFRPITNPPPVNVP